MAQHQNIPSICNHVNQSTGTTTVTRIEPYQTQHHPCPFAVSGIATQPLSSESG